MKQRPGMRFKRILLTGFLATSFAGRILAGWNGAGVAGGTGGVDINDPANWTGGIIDNDYSSITENADLQLTADHTVTNGLNFGTAAGVVHHLTINGTNTLTLDENQLSAYVGHVLLPANSRSTVTFGKGLTLDFDFPPSGNCILIGAGQLVVDSLITGAGGLRPVRTENGTYLNLYLLNNANTFTGEPSPLDGSLYFTSIADSGVPSALGAGDSLLIQRHKFVYIGTRDNYSNRRIRLNVEPILRNDSACGSLVLTGEVLMSDTRYDNDISFGGISSGTNLLEGHIVDNIGAPPGLTRLKKIDSGTWRLTGMNTFTGFAKGDDVSVSGGKLIADYVDDHVGAGSNRLFLAGRSVSMGDGQLVFQGKTGAGNTTFQELGIFTVEDYSANTLTVDGNGGDGTTVEVASFESVGTSSMLLIDRKEGTTLRTASAIPTSDGTVRLVNGILMKNNGSDSLFLIRDPDGKIGFPTQADDLSIIRHTNSVELTESNAATYAGDHLSLASDITRTADLSFSTLVIDATENAVTLDMGGKRIQTENSSVGRGIVAYGSHPVTVTGGEHGNQKTSLLFNYGTGTLTWDISNSKVYTAGGTGLIEFTQPFGAFFTVMGGTARLVADMPYNSGSGRIRIRGDGVLELGADLNGEDSGDFTGGLNVPGGILFYGGGGFSAYGRDRTVNLGGSKEQMIWGTTVYFIKDGKPFVLSSPYADATLIFENPLALSPQSTWARIENAAREIRVHNGSAAIDARLTGAISSGHVIVGIVKSGDGTLELTGTQDYRGNVSVIGGGLRLGAAGIYYMGNALVLGNGTLDAGASHNDFDTLEILADSTINVEDRSASLSFADSSGKPWTGTLNITGVLRGKTLRFGTDKYGLTKAQLESIIYGDGQESLELDHQGYLVRPSGSFIFIR